MADVLKQLSFMKELTDVLKVAFPGLAEIAQKTEYEITISNDRKGLRLSCYVGAPIDLESDQPAQPIEIETIEIPTEDLHPGDVFFEDRDLIVKALAKFDLDHKKAAEALGISLRTLKRKNREYHITLKDVADQKERNNYQEALDACGGNTKQAAERLGVPEKFLRSRMLELGM